MILKVLKPLALVFIIALLAMYSYKTWAWPDHIDINAGLKQHNKRSPLCEGDGTSKKLTSEVAAKAVWVMQKDFSYYAGYSKEYCMLNEKSKSDGMIEIGINYRFDL